MRGHVEAFLDMFVAGAKADGFPHDEDQSQRGQAGP